MRVRASTVMKGEIHDHVPHGSIGPGVPGRSKPGLRDGSRPPEERPRQQGPGNETEHRRGRTSNGWMLRKARHAEIEGFADHDHDTQPDALKQMRDGNLLIDLDGKAATKHQQEHFENNGHHPQQVAVGTLQENRAETQRRRREVVIPVDATGKPTPPVSQTGRATWPKARCGPRRRQQRTTTRIPRYRRALPRRQARPWMNSVGHRDCW